MLDHITIEGFKSIASVQDLALGDVTVVIGANGSGKSNFIGVFSFLHALREGKLQEYVAKAGGADRILHFGSKTSQSLRVCVSFNDRVNQYDIRLQYGGADQLIPVEEHVSFWDKARYARAYDETLWPQGKEAGISAPDTRISAYVRAHLASWRKYHFHDTSADSPMKKTCDVNDNRFLRPDGSNLAAFLYFLKAKHEGSYRMIRRTVQQVAPFFDDFILEPQQLNQDKIRLEWANKSSDAYFDASSLSDGTLRFMALTTLFLQPVEFRPSIILVDEPELGLHPHAITMLASLVRQASTRTQVILSTQSSLLLDHFDPEQVLVADVVEGATQFSRLESEQLSAWMGDYSLGQLWEKNYLGGRPGDG